MKFIYPNIPFIEFRQEEYVLKKIMTELKSHIGRVFEKVCLSILSKKFHGYKVGAYWDREGNEVDAIAISEEKVMFFECKIGKLSRSDAIKFKGKISILAKKLNFTNFQSCFIVPEKSKDEIERIKILELKQLLS
jgi:hypothetical protein